MAFDKGTFLILVGTIAAAGVGGWFAREKLVLRSDAPPKGSETPPAPEPSGAAAVKSAAPEPSAKSAEAPAPSCDDAVGETPDCSRVPIGPDPSEEGGCNLAKLRCAQYREAFKPKPARASIHCLERLRGNQICDPVMVNKCGHEALMLACPPDATGVAGDAATSDLDKLCREVLASCGDATPGPTLADCRQTVSGMNDVGRRKLIACMKTQCDARGLYGCEAR